MQGMCQGNGASPSAWGMVSITILDAHKRHHSEATFICPISTIQRNAVVILFVDDTDLVQPFHRHLSAKGVLTHLSASWRILVELGTTMIIWMMMTFK